MANRINKVTTQTKTYTSPKMVDGKLSYTLYDSDGNNIGQTLVDPGTDMSNAKNNYFTKGANGLWEMSEIPETSISINEETGNIKIKAPKAVTETEQFKQFIDEEQLKEYSQAYKLNKDFKLQVTEKDEETGEDKNTEVTLPEYIERLNSSLTKYMNNLRSQRNYTDSLVQAYGDKAKNLTEAQIVMSAQGSKGADATYLPDSVLNVESFGNGIKNPFRGLATGDNGEISAEELAKAWTRENFGREEVAALMAHINGRLNGAGWNEETYYEDADGNLIYDRNSAEEMAKLIAFKNYILNNNPNAEWYQQAGDWIEAAALNFTNAVTNVFANLAVMGEGAIDMLPGVEARGILDWKNESDETMTNYNAMNAQAWDAVVNAQIWGYLVGTVAGSMAAGRIGKTIAKDLGFGGSTAEPGAVQQTNAATTVHLRNIAKEMASELDLTGAAAEALSPKTMALMFEGGEYARLGTRLWLAGLTLADKALTATNVALSAISGTANRSIITEYLLDTIHDAILYDGTTLRNVIEALQQDDSNKNRQEVVNYWLGQFAENAKFWVPIGVARTAIKYAGKTDVGKAVNAVTTRLVNKIAANAGDAKQALRNKLANGSVVKKLEDDIEKALDKRQFTKANRLQRKLDIENWNELTRQARRRLGDLELEWEGGKLTTASLEKFNRYVSDVKILENGIDAYNRDVLNKIDEMTIKQIDPSTGKRMFMNPELGGANVKATMYYWDLVELSKKHGLSVAKDSLLNQDVIDLWVSKYYKGLADSFAARDGLKAAKAYEASQVLQKNIDTLSKVVPQEIQDYIDNMLSRRVYQSWYYAQNDYGMHKGLLNKERIMGYQNNPIWQENGYMPIQVQHDLSGHWIDNSGRIDAVIEQDFDALTFNVAEGQHYVDPEMVRQSRLRKMAQAEINKDLLKAYNGFTGSATNVTMVSGQQTAYVDKVQRNEAYLEKAIESNSSAAFEENFNVEAILTRRRRPVKNEIVAEDIRETVVASMSPSETADALVKKKVLSHKGAKLTDNITADNYDDWYANVLNESARKYLAQQYSIVGAEEGLSDAGVFDLMPSTYEHRGMLSVDPADAPYGYKTLADYYKKEKGITAEFVYMTPDEYLAALTVENGGPYKSVDEIIERSRARQTTPQGRKGYLDYAEDMRNGNFDPDMGEGKFPPPYLIYSPDGYSGQEGIHRALAAKEAGVTKMPVSIQYPVNAMPPEAKRLLKNKEAVDRAAAAVDVSGADGVAMLNKAIANGGDDFEAGLQRAYLTGDESFAKTSVMNEAARNLANGKDAFYQGVIVAKIKGETKNILYLDTDAFWDDMASTIRGQVDDYVYMVKTDPGARAAIDTLSETTNGSDDAATYIALRQLKAKGMQSAYDAIDEQIDGLQGIGKLAKDDVDILKNKAHDLLDYTVDTELDLAANATKTINAELVDSKDIYDKSKELAKKIEGADAKLSDDYIMYLDDQGRQVYAQVDPAFASLFNTRARITKAEASKMAKFNALASRAFRYGTTSLNLTAFGNQMFRDFGNAILVGGAWQTIKSNADNLKDVFGERIVEQIKAFDPDEYEMRQIMRLAQESGQTVEGAAVSRELMRGSAIAGTTTETSLYRDFMRQAYNNDTDTLLNNAKGKIRELWDKYDPDKYMNGKRENYLRNRVYASSLNDAMKEGYSLSQARVYAEFAMNNATTNFARQLYHMQAIADSTPYFRAAINGTKSFWRMWSLDPVGITGRIMGGMILPVMFLTGASLGSDKNREVYKNIPEYQKGNSLVFVLNGEAIQIPLPQELSPLVAPFRQFVEYLYDSNPNDFWELMANDLLGFSPYDFTGFTAIDYDKMIEDPTFFDRTSRGFARLFSQMAPIPLKSAYMIASGTDPYTGKWLRDPSYAYWNDETNSIETMDYYQSTFAGWIAKLFPKMNPAIADRVVSGVFGTTGSNLLGDITTFVMEGPEAAALSAGKNIFEQATRPVTVEQYDLVDAVWERAVRQLTAEKQELLSDKRLVAINQELQQTKDPEKRQQLLAERQNLTDAYKERVAQMVERLSTEYKGSFDRKKFAAVVALLNFNSDAMYQSGSQYSSNLASEMYWNGRDEAIHTMERMGISGTSDMSIFGYLTVNRSGEAVMRYSLPTAIMDMEYQWQKQGDINAANIKALLTESSMYDAHKAISDQISKIYGSKKKLSNQDYATIDAIKINWNAQLAKVIAPYISQMTPEAVLNNRTVLNLLYPYVEVPNSWANKSVGSRGNKKQAYYESWIKSMFSVNDPYKGQY